MILGLPMHTQSQKKVCVICRENPGVKVEKPKISEKIPPKWVEAR